MAKSSPSWFEKRGKNHGASKFLALTFHNFGLPGVPCNFLKMGFLRSLDLHRPPGMPFLWPSIQMSSELLGNTTSILTPYWQLEADSPVRSQLGIIVPIRKRFAVRKRHQNKHLDFRYVLLRTRRPGVRISPGAPLLVGPMKTPILSDRVGKNGSPELNKLYMNIT